MKDRQYYIDWIRVIAFGILIFYHSGMFFVDWGWLVRNNVAAKGFQIWMNLVNPWRLSLLFFISGVGVKFALKSRIGVDFFGERSKKLLLPLAFGMLVVVPPQIYFERLQMHSFTGSYTAFYLQIYKFFTCNKGGLNWQHLWFVAYLWVFSVIALPFFLWLQNKSFHFFKLKNPISSFFKILLFALPLSITYWTLKQQWDITNNLVSDWYNFTLSFLFFIYGYIFASQPFSWVIIEKYRKIYLTIGLSVVILMKLYNTVFGYPIEDCMSVVLVNGFLRMLFIWCIILAICGFAKHYLNFSNKFVRYANKVVYPFYIIHQTITVTIGFYIADLEMSVGSKFAILVVGTFGITFLIYHFLIRPFRVMRLLFGMIKTNKGVEMKDFDTPLTLSPVPLRA
ncbi:acyltransferase family protein [Emticicia sp. SJ17W-69]|uniref:acyltransferase family protein n=1 Tax=Emticicia sp. SJ17W-69 TaxID=3421657 RepID=UPI003EB8596B